MELFIGHDDEERADPAALNQLVGINLDAQLLPLGLIIGLPVQQVERRVARFDTIFITGREVDIEDQAGAQYGGKNFRLADLAGFIALNGWLDLRCGGGRTHIRGLFRNGQGWGRFNRGIRRL